MKLTWMHRTVQKLYGHSAASAHLQLVVESEAVHDTSQTGAVACCKLQPAAAARKVVECAARNLRV